MENTRSRRESQEEAEKEDSSEEDSPMKRPVFSSRATRVGLKTPRFVDLNEELSNLRDDQIKNLEQIC